MSELVPILNKSQTDAFNTIERTNSNVLILGQAGTGMLTDGISAAAVAEAIKKYFAENKKEEYLYNISRLKKELGWEAFATRLEDFINTL